LQQKASFVAINVAKEVDFLRVGYVRCSTIEQNEARQLKMMEEQKVEKIFIDKASGKNTERESFRAMMAFIREGDTVIVESISRIARNTRDLLTIVATLTERGVEFVSLKENIDTTTPHGRFMLTVFGALAELERESILERQREGIEIAKAEGKYKGRKPVEIDEAKFRAVCARWRAGDISATVAMKELDLKPNTFYRRVRDMKV
jgi:DNA invertase Pin-like site-specific DNA recombinase